MRVSAKIFPTRLPAFSPVRLGSHRHFAAVMPRRRASLVLRPVGAFESVSTAAPAFPWVELRRPADARHAA
jgi:hypothetical protein